MKVVRPWVMNEEGWEARRLRHDHAHPRLLAVQQVRDVWLANVKEQKPMGAVGERVAFLKLG